ncbi:MAG: aspartate carbamoyltransferase catalytic subunit [Clostridiales bacterium]|nr:aspartate carbamoyltransferase catalytic subunit [Clostridiales bacterium]
MFLNRKDFLGIRDLTAEELNYILKTAETMKFVINQKNKKVPHLQGKSVIMLFYDYSTRAKLAYELAAQHLSANVIDMDATAASEKKERLQDVGQLIDQMGADFIILRHPMSGAARILADCVEASVINAGDGHNENPGQSLLDLMTIKERKGGFEDLRVAIIGDITHSRVAKSNIWGLLKLGAEVRVTGPSTLIPSELESFGVKVCFDPREAVDQADVILSTRIAASENCVYKIPSLDEYRSMFLVDENLMKYAKDDAIVMHPGQIQRGVEIATSVINSPQCIVNDQIGNSVAVRMAMLYILSQIGGGLHEAFD